MKIMKISNKKRYRKSHSNNKLKVKTTSQINNKQNHKDKINFKWDFFFKFILSFLFVTITLFVFFDYFYIVLINIDYDPFWFTFFNFLLFIYFWHLIKTKNIVISIKWLLWDFSGLRLIWGKIFPASIDNKSKPASFFLWFVGIYIALFGIASQRYENQVDAIEAKSNVFFALLEHSDPKVRKQSLSLIPEIQNLPCSIKPEVYDPKRTVLSLFYEVGSSQNDRIIDKILKINKSNLNDLELSRVNLEVTTLEGANLKKTVLENANFQYADLANVNFQGADLQGADLEGADLQNANFQGANLTSANFQNANLANANLENAKFKQHIFGCISIKRTNLRGANLRGANLKVTKKLEYAIFKCTKYDDNTKFPDGFNPEEYGLLNISDFFRASYKGDVKRVKYFIEKGVDVLSFNKDALTALDIACIGGHLKLVKYLLTKGARINEWGAPFNSIRENTVKNGHHEIVEFMDSFKKKKTK